jgi:hypothetical protein
MICSGSTCTRKTKPDQNMRYVLNKRRECRKYRMTDDHFNKTYEKECRPRKSKNCSDQQEKNTLGNCIKKCPTHKRRNDKGNCVNKGKSSFL